MDIQFHIYIYNVCTCSYMNTLIKYKCSLLILTSTSSQALGLHGALDIYLTDSTYSTSACVKAGYLHGVQAALKVDDL